MADNRWKGSLFAESFDDFLQGAITTSYFFCDEENSVFVVADPNLTSEEIKLKLKGLTESGRIEGMEEEIKKTKEIF